MLSETISNLNLEQLKSLIISIVDERIEQKQNSPSTPNRKQLQEIFNSIDAHIWIPPSSTPSTLEILQEEGYK